LIDGTGIPIIKSNSVIVIDDKRKEDPRFANLLARIATLEYMLDLTSTYYYLELSEAAFKN